MFVKAPSNFNILPLRCVNLFNPHDNPVSRQVGYQSSSLIMKTMKLQLSGVVCPSDNKNSVTEYTDPKLLTSSPVLIPAYPISLRNHL